MDLKKGNEPSLYEWLNVSARKPSEMAKGRRTIDSQSSRSYVYKTNLCIATCSGAHNRCVPHLKLAKIGQSDCLLSSIRFDYQVVGTNKGYFIDKKSLQQIDIRSCQLKRK